MYVCLFVFSVICAFRQMFTYTYRSFKTLKSSYPILSYQYLAQLLYIINSYLLVVHVDIYCLSNSQNKPGNYIYIFSQSL